MSRLEMEERNLQADEGPPSPPAPGPGGLTPSDRLGAPRNKSNSSSPQSGSSSQRNVNCEMSKTSDVTQSPDKVNESEVAEDMNVSTMSISGLLDDSINTNDISTLDNDLLQHIDVEQLAKVQKNKTCRVRKAGRNTHRSSSKSSSAEKTSELFQQHKLDTCEASTSTPSAVVSVRNNKSEGCTGDNDIAQKDSKKSSTTPKKVVRNVRNTPKKQIQSDTVTGRDLLDTIEHETASQKVRSLSTKFKFKKPVEKMQLSRSDEASPPDKVSSPLNPPHGEEVLQVKKANRLSQNKLPAKKGLTNDATVDRSDTNIVLSEKVERNVRNTPTKQIQSDPVTVKKGVTNDASVDTSDTNIIPGKDMSVTPPPNISLSSPSCGSISLKTLAKLDKFSFMENTKEPSGGLKENSPSFRETNFVVSPEHNLMANCKKTINSCDVPRSIPENNKKTKTSKLKKLCQALEQSGSYKQGCGSKTSSSHPGRDNIKNLTSNTLTPKSINSIITDSTQRPMSSGGIFSMGSDLLDDDLEFEQWDVAIKKKPRLT